MACTTSNGGKHGPYCEKKPFNGPKPAPPPVVPGPCRIGRCGFSKNTRADLAATTNLGQQSLPNPVQRDLRRVNQTARRAHQHSDFVVRLPAIPPEDLILTLHTDSSLNNVGWRRARTRTCLPMRLRGVLRAPALKMF